jgi:hypothetical protein
MDRLWADARGDAPVYYELNRREVQTAYSVYASWLSAKADAKESGDFSVADKLRLRLFKMGYEPNTMDWRRWKESPDYRARRHAQRDLYAANRFNPEFLTRDDRIAIELAPESERPARGVLMDGGQWVWAPRIEKAEYMERRMERRHNDWGG